MPSISELRATFEHDTLSRDSVEALLETADSLQQNNDALRSELAQMKRRLEWFERQIFGSKSERRVVATDALQGTLGEAFDQLPTKEPAKKDVAAHKRAVARKPAAEDDGQFFDERRVPVEVIELPAPEIAGLTQDQYEQVSDKVSHRLAQRPGAFVVLKYVRKVYKLRQTGNLVCAPAPVGVIEGSRADVSFIAAMMVDKLTWHLPLHRQHQRLQQAGFKVSRPWLTQLLQAAAELLRPVYEAHARAVLSSRVRAMDETPIKAGVVAPGKMRQAYFWPVYGDQDEIAFFYYPDREHKNVIKALGLSPPDGAVLLTDGYQAYNAYAQATGLTHANCWAHARREVFEARDVEPQDADFALERIAEFYAIEEKIRQDNLTGNAKLRTRIQRTKPLMDRFMDWVDDKFSNHGFLPSNPFLKAMGYIRERRDELRVFLGDADVPIDTNHLERSLRTIAVGRKNWMFCWTELGAEHIAQLQSLLVTCRLQGVDGYDYLVDVLQRIGQHPASRVHELTPREWKMRFSSNPLRSPVHQPATQFKHAA